MSEYFPGQDKTLDKLMSTVVDSDEAQPYVRAVIFGDYGTGKSTLAATAGKKILWIDAGERGWMSVKNHPELWPNISKIMQFDSVEGLVTLAKYIEAGKFPVDFDTIVWDTLTDISEQDLKAVTRKRKGNTLDAVPEWPEFRINGERMELAFSEFRKLPYNLVFTCQMRMDEDKELGKLLRRPEFPRQVGKYFLRLGHLVGYTFTEGDGNNRTYKLQVHPQKNIAAKTRIGGLPTVIENPNLTEIFSKWSG